MSTIVASVPKIPKLKKNGEPRKARKSVDSTPPAVLSILCGERPIHFSSFHEWFDSIRASKIHVALRRWSKIVAMGPVDVSGYKSRLDAATDDDSLYQVLAVILDEQLALRIKQVALDDARRKSERKARKLSRSSEPSLAAAEAAASRAQTAAEKAARKASDALAKLAAIKAAPPTVATDKAVKPDDKVKVVKVVAADKVKVDDKVKVAPVADSALAAARAEFSKLKADLALLATAVEQATSSKRKAKAQAEFDALSALVKNAALVYKTLKAQHEAATAEAVAEEASEGSAEDSEEEEESSDSSDSSEESEESDD